MSIIKLNGYDLSLEDLIKVCRYGHKVELTEKAIERIKTARAIVDDLVENEKVSYGITTGFGKFSDVQTLLSNSSIFSLILLLKISSSSLLSYK